MKPAVRYAVGHTNVFSRRMKPTAVSLFCLLALPFAALAAQEEQPTPNPALTPPPIAIPEAKIEGPRLPTAADFARPTPTPTFTAPVIRDRRLGGEYAYARVVGDTVDFEIVRELPSASVTLEEVFIPLFARNELDSDQVLSQAALQLEWGAQTIRDFQRVEVPGKNASPDGVVVYWYTPSANAQFRLANVRNAEGRMRISFRQPLIGGRVIFATALPRIEFVADQRPWHRQLFIRSLRSNLLGRVSAGVENERLGDGLLVLHRDEAYVEIVAAPPSRPAQ